MVGVMVEIFYAVIGPAAGASLRPKKDGVVYFRDESLYGGVWESGELRHGGTEGESWRGKDEKKK